MLHAVFVDDNPDASAMISAYARQEDVDVAVFQNGTDALNHLNDTPTDVVVLDLMMAPLDGLTIAEEIRRNEEIHLINPPVRMAFLTAATISEAVERVAERVNVEEIFHKPCDYSKMFREIKGWFEH